MAAQNKYIFLKWKEIILVKLHNSTVSETVVTRSTKGNHIDEGVIVKGEFAFTYKSYVATRNESYGTLPFP